MVNAAGPAPLTRAELAFREKVGAKLRQWRLDEGLTQELLGARINPGSANPKAYVWRVEKNDGGNFDAHALSRHCRAIAPHHTLAELLIESGAERMPAAENPAAQASNRTLDTIREDPHLTRQYRQVALAVVTMGHADYAEASTQTLRSAERRDVARQVGMDEALLNAWTRLSEDQRQRIAAYVAEEAAANEATPAPKSRRRPKGE